MLKLILAAVLVTYVRAQCGDCTGYNVKEPLCVTDGQVYKTLANACVFKVAACEYVAKGVTLSIAYKGECTTTDAQSVKPIVSQTLTATSTGTRCSYTRCDGTEPAVKICGSDGNVYTSKCEFANAACKYQMNGGSLTVVDCNTQTRPDLSGLAIETTDKLTSGTNTLTATGTRCTYTRCDGTEPAIKICGSDGNVYTSKCEFANAACKYQMNGGSLTVVDCNTQTRPDLSGLAIETTDKLTSGTNTLTAADKCANLNLDCGTDVVYICGTDGVTYQNKCDFYTAKCIAGASGQTLDVAYLGQCRTASLATSVLG